MPWVECITLIALIEYFVFSLIVGRARTRYGVHAPAVTGHPLFERAYRVQMNTLEVLLMFLPVLWIASRYWPSAWTAGLGVVFVIGRAVYARAYLRDPARRSVGFGLSMLPVLALFVMALMGVAGWR